MMWWGGSTYRNISSWSCPQSAGDGPPQHLEGDECCAVCGRCGRPDNYLLRRGIYGRFRQKSSEDNLSRHVNFGPEVGKLMSGVWC